MIIIEKHPCCWLLHTKDNGRNASRYYFKLQGITPGSWALWISQPDEKKTTDSEISVLEQTEYSQRTSK
jgi:hypothetical protein